MSQPPIAWPLSFPLKSVFIQIEGLHSYNWPLLILIYKITHYIQHIVLGNSPPVFCTGPCGLEGTTGCHLVQPAAWRRSGHSRWLWAVSCCTFKSLQGWRLWTSRVTATTLLLAGPHSADHPHFSLRVWTICNSPFNLWLTGYGYYRRSWQRSC